MRDAYGFRLMEYLERGDIDAFVEDEQRCVAPLTSKMRQPFYDYIAINYALVPTLLAGRFDEAERFARQALEFGHKMRVENYDGVYSMQMFTIRREQGRLRELAPVVQLIVSQNPEAAIWRPGLALMYAELEMRAAARAEFEVLARNNFADIARDALWITTMVYLSEVCVYLGDQERAATLYQLLLPYDGRNIVVGYHASCLGAAARYLALLATVLSDWKTAERHFEDALAMNEQMGARPWLAHTQFEYSKMMLAHGGAEDQRRARDLMTAARETAVALGMSALVNESKAQKDSFSR